MPPESTEQARWFLEEVQPHDAKLRAYLRRQFPSLSDVDDVVQESHLRLLKARETSPIASAKSYLFAIARNVALGVFRQRRKIVEVPVNEIAEFGILEGVADVAEAASLQNETAIAVEAIETLPGRCREIVALSALHGLSHREIAGRLGLAEETVRVQVARGMKKCAEYLRARGITRSRS
jgi:RNA polymerase sigma-70 factor (ECF subfamily)